MKNGKKNSMRIKNLQNSPAGHAEQFVSSYSEYEPGGHTCGSDDGSHEWPAGHFVQLAEPPTLVYRPV